MFKTFDKSIINNQRIISLLTDFFYGKYYPVYVAMFTAFFYAAQIPLAGLIFFTLLASATLLIFRDLTPFMSLPMMILMSLSNFTLFSNPIVFVFIGLVVVSLIAHFILYPIKKFVFGKLFVPICLVSSALLCGGLFSEYMDVYFNGITSALSVGPAVLFIYIFFTNYSCPPENFNYKEHILYLLLVVGAMLSVEMLIHEYYNFIGIMYKFDMGFGNINITATALLMTIPTCWYFICTRKEFIPYAVVLFLIYLAIFFSHSDGVLALAVAFIPVLAVLGYKKTDEWHRKIFIKVALVICFFALAVVLIYSINHNLEAIILKYLNKVKTDNNRTALYKRALELFSKYPVFGASLGYMDASLINSPDVETFIVYMLSFHSTFFHILGTMGLFGLAMYIIYYIARYKIILHKNSMFNVTVFLSFTMYQIYGMISHEEFQLMPILLFSTLLLLTTEKSNKEKDNEPLPLTKKDFKYKAF